MGQELGPVVQNIGVNLEPVRSILEGCEDGQYNTLRYILVCSLWITGVCCMTSNDIGVNTPAICLCSVDGSEDSEWSSNGEAIAVKTKEGKSTETES